MNNANVHTPRVAVASGETRVETVRKALSLVRNDILSKIHGTVLIKPNFVSSTRKFAATQADAVRPLLELMRETDVDSVTIGEGGTQATEMAFRNFGYETLARDFDVELLDLNDDVYNQQFDLITQTRGTHTIQYCNTAVSADTVISVAVAKTHDYAMVTLSLKNMMGCLRRMQRPRVHGVELGGIIETPGEKLWNFLDRSTFGMKIIMGIVFGSVRLSRYISKKAHHGAQPGLLAQVRAVSENLARLGNVLMPDIAVIDGFEVMEGQGPAGGTAVTMGVAVAGTDPIACDAVMAYMMGFDPLSIGYLALAHEQGLGCADIQKIEITGEDPLLHRRKLKPHSNYPVQLRWREAW